MPSTCSKLPSSSWLDRHLDDVTEFILLFPSLLWVANWIIWPIAAPLCLGMVWMYVRHWRKRQARFCGAEMLEQERKLRPQGIILCLLLAAALTFLASFDGRLMQTGDFIVRNAIYGELIASPWPLILEDGSFVVYAVQYWLPPALVASCFPEWKIPLLQGWFFVGLFIIELQLLRMMGGKKTLILTVCLMMVGTVTSNNMKDVDMFNIIPSALSDCTATYHFFILGMLMNTIFLNPRTTYPQLLFCSSLLFLCAPLTSLFYAPILAWRTGKLLRKAPRDVLTLPELYVGVGVACCQLLFSSSATGAHMSLTLLEQSSQIPMEVNVYQTLTSMLMTFAPMLMAYYITHEKFLLYCGIFSTVCVFVCITGAGVINELLFKTSTAYCFFFVYFLVKHFNLPTARAYVFLMVVLNIPQLWGFVINTKQINKAVACGFAAQPANIVAPPQWRISQLNDYFFEPLVSHCVKFAWLFQHNDRIHQADKTSHPSG